MMMNRIGSLFASTLSTTQGGVAAVEWSTFSPSASVVRRSHLSGTRLLHQGSSAITQGQVTSRQGIVGAIVVGRGFGRAFAFSTILCLDDCLFHSN